MTHALRTISTIALAAGLVAVASSADANPHRHVKQAPITADNYAPYAQPSLHTNTRHYAPMYASAPAANWYQHRERRQARIDRRSRKLTRKTFRRLDLNRDRYLSYYEASQRLELRNRFWRIDRNRDGYLSRAEVKSYHALRLARRDHRLARF